ncbi:hypothetical protein ACWKSP_31180 [Micromonosporaceae bacterium Da 78-11]
MSTQDADRSVSIPLDRAIHAVQLLESIVISLDRIGSRMAFGEADAHTLDEFMTEWLIGPRLSRARFVLWDAIAEVIGEEAVEEIAESTPSFPDPVPDEVHTRRAELRSRHQESGAPELGGNP